MNPRVNYEMTEQDLQVLLDACKPVPYIAIGGHAPSSPQENANRAWAALGQKMGFDSMTVRPILGQGMRFFSAVPSETEAQRAERIAIEHEASRKAEIAKTEKEIALLQARLAELSGARGEHGA